MRLFRRSRKGPPRRVQGSAWIPRQGASPGGTLQGTAQSTVTTPKLDPATSPHLGPPRGISLFLHPAQRRMQHRDPFDPAKPNGGTEREETILQSPRHAPPRHWEHGQGESCGGGTQHPTKSRSPAGKQRGGRSPWGYPPCCATHVAGARRVLCMPTRSWRGGLRVAHVCPAAAPEVFAHARAQTERDHIKC